MIRVIVGVPVRDEAARLPRLLDALAAQCGGLAFSLSIALDGCLDDSGAIVAARRGDLPFDVATVELDRGDPNAGRARREAMALALAMAGDDDSAILVSTDADSVPDRHWVARNVAALDVADVAAGRIVRERGEPSPTQDRVETYYDALFALRRALDPVPWEATETHHYTSGASLSFRAGVYRTLGGFEPLPSAEDARLIDAAHIAGYRVRRDAAIRVETSARRHGRTTDGLADHLRRLDDMDGAAGATMAHPADVAWRYRGHAAARRAWAEIDVRAAALATELGVPVADVRTVAAASINGEAFAARVVPEIAGGERSVTLDVAERALADLCIARGPAA